MPKGKMTPAAHAAHMRHENFEKLGAAFKAVIDETKKSDPDKAFLIAQELFKLNSGAMNLMTTIEGPNNTSSWQYSSDSTVKDLMAALLTKNPARTMELQTPNSEPFGSVAQMWAELDIVAYTHWVNQHTDPKIRDTASAVLVNQLIQQEQFTEAAEWTMSSKTARDNLVNLMYQWNRSDPAEARKWMETTDLTESERDKVDEFLKQNP